MCPFEATPKGCWHGKDCNFKHVASEEREQTFYIIEYYSHSCEGDDGRWNQTVSHYTCWCSFCEKGIGGHWCK
eukprot:5932438-Prorocentrum_lima.AAC.1